MATVFQLDDNLRNGLTYTFQFKCTNWLVLPSVTTVQQDIVANAPDFLTSLGVTSPFTTSLYNVQFTYEGDGSDVVSDVANELIAAVQAGSNDGMVLVGAVQASAVDVTVTPLQAAAQVEQTVTSGVKQAATDVTQAVLQPATGAVNTALVGLLPTLIVIVLIILFVLPSLAKSAGAVQHG